MEEKHKVWCQQHHCEALAQLAVHDDSREALLRDGSVIPALEAVSKSGLCEKARELAAAALVARTHARSNSDKGKGKDISLILERVDAAEDEKGSSANGISLRV